MVTLLLMDDAAQTLFEREPMGLVLYNKIVKMHHDVRPRSHGNFLPSLDLAEKMLKQDCDSSDTCALCLLFLSDGRPSDHATGHFRGNQRMTSEAIAGRVGLLSAPLKNRLTVATLGFAHQEQDFSVLEAMAKAAADSGAHGEFHRPELSAAGLGSAIARSVSSLTATRTRLTSLASTGGRSRVIRQVEREAAHGANSWVLAPTAIDTGKGDGWVVHPHNVRRFDFRSAAMRGESDEPWVQVGLSNETATGIAIRRKAFGEGAERLVFRLQVWIIVHPVVYVCVFSRLCFFVAHFVD